MLVHQTPEPTPELPPVPSDDELEAMAAEASDEAAEAADTSPRARLRAATISTATLKAMPPAEPLIGGLLDRNSLALLYGPSGASKSFLAVDLALHVATGSWWHRREVHQGPVVYVAAEGAGGLGGRVAAWQDHHQLHDFDRYAPVWWVTMPVHLFHHEWAGAFAELCGELEAALVVVDTLARCSLGADENSARDAGRLVDSLDLVRRSTGACVVAVHHTGKDTTAGARGSSALRAAVDTELELTAADDLHTLRVTKQKDGAAPGPIRLARIPVADSCVLIADTGHTGSTPGHLTRSAEAALEALHAIAVPGGLSASAWQTATDVSPRSFYNARSDLLRLGHVTNVGSDRAPRYLPTNPTEDQP